MSSCSSAAARPLCRLTPGPSLTDSFTGSGGCREDAAESAAAPPRDLNMCSCVLPARLFLCLPLTTFFWALKSVSPCWPFYPFCI